MAFSHRIATLTAVVAIPLGIAATSYALTDSPDPPDAPGKVELDNSKSPSPGKPDPSDSPSKGNGSTSPSSVPSDEAVPRPSATDDGDDDGGQGGDDDADDGPGDDG